MENFRRILFRESFMRIFSLFVALIVAAALSSCTPRPRLTERQLYETAVKISARYNPPEPDIILPTQTVVLPPTQTFSPPPTVVLPPTATAEPEDDPEPGALDFRDLDGERFRISDYRGKKVYMKYWTTWCSICVASLDELEALSRDTSRDFEVVTVIGPDYGGEMSLNKFREWFANQPYNDFRVLIDQDGEVAQEYGIRGYPTSFFIDPNGGVHVFSGQLDNDTIREVFASKEMSGE